MTTRRGGKHGHSRMVVKRYAIIQASLRQPAPRLPAQSKAELRRIADEAISKWIRDHQGGQP